MVLYKLLKTHIKPANLCYCIIPKLFRTIYLISRICLLDTDQINCSSLMSLDCNNDHSGDTQMSKKDKQEWPLRTCDIGMIGGQNQILFMPDMKSNKFDGMIFCYTSFSKQI